jgi:hypothetical protein
MYLIPNVIVQQAYWVNDKNSCAPRSRRCTDRREPVNKCKNLPVCSRSRIMRVFLIFKPLNVIRRNPYTVNWSRDSSVGIATGWTAGFDSRHGKIFSLSTSSRPALGPHPASYPAGTGSEATGPRSCPTHLYLVRGQEWWSYTSTSCLRGIVLN